MCGYSHIGFKEIETERGTYLTECHHLLRWKDMSIRKRRREECNIPIIYRGLTLPEVSAADIDAKSLRAIIKAIRQGTSLNIIGGSTQLASAIGNTLIKLRRAVRYTTAAELAAELRYTAENYMERLRYYREIEVLIIDEFGLERRSEYTDEQLYIILGHRRRNGYQTIIMSEDSERSEVIERELKGIESVINGRVAKPLKWSG